MHAHKYFRKQCLKEDSVHLLRTRSLRLRDHRKGEGDRKILRARGLEGSE